MASEFDDRAATWDDDPEKVERGRAVARSVSEAVPLTPATRMLEYGAGTGLTAQALASEVGAITLADPSDGMRAVMGEKVAAGVFPVGTRVWDLDLGTEPVPDERFDLIVSVMVLHHILDLESVLSGFASLLADGGYLCVVDLEEDADGAFHRDRPGFEGHDGFDRDDLAVQLEAAGFVDIRFAHCLDVDKAGTSFPLFLATAVTSCR